MIPGNMRDYARHQVSLLLRQVIFELHRSPNAPSSEAVHDLRVSIRRFREVTRVFQQFFPSKELKAIRKRLRKVLDLAGKVREKDIVLEFFDKAGIDASAGPRRRLAYDRRRSQRRLAGALQKWNRKDLAQPWRAELELPAK